MNITYKSITTAAAVSAAFVLSGCDVNDRKQSHPETQPHAVTHEYRLAGAFDDELAILNLKCSGSANDYALVAHVTVSTHSTARSVGHSKSTHARITERGFRCNQDDLWGRTRVFGACTLFLEGSEDAKTASFLDLNFGDADSGVRSLCTREHTVNEPAVRSFLRGALGQQPEPN